MPGDNGSEELRIGVYVCHCGSNIAGVIDPKVVTEFALTLPGIVHATDALYACTSRPFVPPSPRPDSIRS
jgi:heterodisulfide reductase subunit A